MKNTIHFRRAQRQDVEFLLRLRKLTMDEHLKAAGLVLNDEQHLARISEFFDDSFMICRDSQEIGLVKFALLTDRMHIRQFQIMPEFHGQGIGSQVLHLLKKKALERQLTITLNVLLKNPAFNLYQRHGFEVEGKNELEYQMCWRG
ncbi:GNAT family N-acetyltransferase [Thalassotalea insulae]|nr:GNAT family N-acetyltransferase [Thalassotalea insulae]